MDKLLKLVESCSELVESCRERDDLIRLCQYMTRFLAGTKQTVIEQKLYIISVQFVEFRRVLRLFDDIPLLASTLRNGLGKKESNGWKRLLTLVRTCAAHLYFFSDHVIWCVQHKLIDRPYKFWKNACLMGLAVALFTDILRAISEIIIIRKKKESLKKKQQEAPDESDTAETSKIEAKELDNYLDVLEKLADFTKAVNWLPTGILWSGKFSPWFCAGMGTISSAIKIYRQSAKRKVS